MRTAGRFLLLVGVVGLAGCGGTVMQDTEIPFSEGEVRLVRTSVGGALGEERIQLSFEKIGDERTFFEGANFSEFNVGERNGKLHIQMCRGHISKAEPFLVGDLEGEYQLIRLDLDWNCKDKRNEA